MKHIIKHIAILAVALLTTVSAGAETKVVTYSLGEYMGDFYMYDMYDTRYPFGRINDLAHLPKTIHITSLSDAHITITSSGDNTCIGVMNNFGRRGFANNDYTFTFETPDYYISHIRINGLYGGSVDFDNISKTVSVICSGDLWANQFILTLTTEKPRYDISAVTISGIGASYTYTGSALTPMPASVSLTPTGHSTPLTLTAGTDYTISYSQNTFVGTATLTLTGRGDYKGMLSQTFTITPRERVFGGITVTDGYSDARQNTLVITDITDDIAITDDVAVGSISLNRTFTPGATATVMLPFSIAVDKVAGGTFYGFVGIDKYGQSGWEVVMKQLTGTLQPHTPYLFMPSGTEMTFDLGGETVTLKANTQSTYIVEP